VEVEFVPQGSGGSRDVVRCPPLGHQSPKNIKIWFPTVQVTGTDKGLLRMMQIVFKKIGQQKHHLRPKSFKDCKPKK
jgi:hypothetical protein